ncbi:MAG: four-carbon acid sugar kinase family protein, partial [Bacteroidota bacterium]
GTQTVYGVPVITEWSVAAIRAELLQGERLFYLLTNSRALSQPEMEDLISTIGHNIKVATAELGLRCLTIIRGDSTLRGHFPLEDITLATALGGVRGAHVIIPAFFEGGRFTLRNVHYVREGNRLIPVGQTPFAQDRSFGFGASDLRAWVEEKTNGTAKRAEVVCLSLETLRNGSTTTLPASMSSLYSGACCCVNAADYADLKRAALVVLALPDPPVLRTSASFIKALLGLPDRPLLQLRTHQQGRGGLLVVGSHVPKTTAQLRHLLAHNELVAVELRVPELLSGPQDTLAARSEELVVALKERVEAGLNTGANVVLYTSREVVGGKDRAQSLRLSLRVSGILEGVVAGLTEPPAFLLTKGGITSSRIATVSLGVKRAMALGQVQPGVPTWELGLESKFPGLPFVIFPGNVGTEESLSLILQNTII